MDLTLTNSKKLPAIANSPTSKVSVSRNTAGPDAFMNNAAVDNFGTKRFKYDVPAQLVPSSSLPWLTEHERNCIMGNCTIYIVDAGTATTALSILDHSDRKHSKTAIAAASSLSLASIRPIAINSAQGHDPARSTASAARSRLCPGLSSNWITGNLVRKHQLRPKRRQNKKIAEWEERRLVSTGELVELNCSTRFCKHRFHVIEGTLGGFDMLHGDDFMRSD